MAFLEAPPADQATQVLFDGVQEVFGFVPNFFKAQTARPDLIETQLKLTGAILVTEGALTRQQKEYIFLVCSAANLSTYCVTAHCEIVRMLKIEGPEPDQVAIDYTSADLPMNMRALLKFASKLNRNGSKIQESDAAALRKFGFTDQAILETVVIVGLAQFANTVSFGLGTLPDFEPVQLPEPAAV